MTTKHTPGPWRAEGWENLVVNGRDGWTILACPGGSDRSPLEELKANSRLIAAAPELLAALKDLLGDMPEVQGGICQHCGRDYIGDILEGDCPDEDCPAFIARAAIAKAEGAL